MSDKAELIRIGDRSIGGTNPVYIIAEACDNHLGDIDRAKEMALQAMQAGCDAVKYQHHLPDEEMLASTPMSSNFSEPLYDFLKRYALSLTQHKDLKNYCESIGIQYLCTPFSYKAAEELASLGVHALKIGSGEMTDTPSLERMASELRLPMIVSTGMSSYEEISETYELLIQLNTPLALLNCVSEYPPDYEDINLRVLTTMMERYPRAVIGHSDHTPDIYTSLAAVALGASIIEKHVILDKDQPGPDQSVSIDFTQMSALVDGIRQIQLSLGNSKKVHNKEKQIREWAFRSLVTISPIRSGEKLSLENIWSKRPGTGIPSKYLQKIIGKNVKRDLPSNHLLSWEDLASGDQS